MSRGEAQAVDVPPNVVRVPAATNQVFGPVDFFLLQVRPVAIPAGGADQLTEQVHAQHALLEFFTGHCSARLSAGPRPRRWLASPASPPGPVSGSEPPEGPGAGRPAGRSSPAGRRAGPPGRPYRHRRRPTVGPP